jgi:nitrate/nitrite transporter NarK
LLPRTHYGQFCAACALVFHFGQMFLAPLLGFITDKLGNAAVFPWFFCFCAAATVLLYLVYRDWKRLGGDDAYVPPLITDSPAEKAFEVVTAH